MHGASNSYNTLYQQVHYAGPEPLYKRALVIFEKSPAGAGLVG